MAPSGSPARRELPCELPVPPSDPGVLSKDETDENKDLRDCPGEGEKSGARSRRAGLGGGAPLPGAGRAMGEGTGVRPSFGVNVPTGGISGDFQSYAAGKRDT